MHCRLSNFEMLILQILHTSFLNIDKISDCAERKKEKNELTMHITSVNYCKNTLV